MGCTAKACANLDPMKLDAPDSGGPDVAPGPAAGSLAEADALIEQIMAARAAMQLAQGLALTRTAWDLLDAGSHRELSEVRSRRAEIGRQRLFFLYVSGSLREGMALGHELLELTDHPDLVVTRCHVLRGMALTCVELGDFENGLRFGMDGFELAQVLDDPSLLCDSLGALGECFNRIGDAQQSERLLREALAQARRLKGGYQEFAALTALCEMAIDSFLRYRDMGRSQEAGETLQRALGYAREMWPAAQFVDPPNDVLKVVAQGNLGLVLLHLGLTEEARAMLLPSLELARSRGMAAHAWYGRCALAELQMREGHWQVARDSLTALLAEHQGDQGGSGVRRLRHALYLCCKELGLPGEALTHLEAYQRHESARISAQLEVQSRLFVSRIEAEQARRQAERAEAELMRQQQRTQDLERDAHTDPLTGLGNRRLLETRLPPLIDQAGLLQQPMTLVMLDLDHFKAVNDRFGHAVGDQVLVRLAQMLRDNMRAHDHLVRMGGEEFLVLLTSTGRELAQQICERLRVAVERHDWESVHPQLRVTLSLGMASAPSYDMETLTERADAALYRAKREGRNRVCLAP